MGVKLTSARMDWDTLSPLMGVIFQLDYRESGLVYKLNPDA